MHYQDQRLGDLPPHIFAIADNAYAHMLRTKQDQCCIISGESGAGKTESAKHVLKFLAARSSSTAGRHLWVEQQVLAAGTVLEAFGNAKTIRNDNSSRFGKYLSVFFSSDGGMVAASLQHYLLEQSRIVAQGQDERNYHVFYHLLIGAPASSTKTDLGLDNKCDYYHYLNQSGCTTCATIDDVDRWSELQTAFGVLNLDNVANDVIQSLIEVLAMVLAVGNIQFRVFQADFSDAACEIQSGPLLDAAVKQLGMPADVVAAALTQRSTFARGETIVQQVDEQTATALRDSFVKALYSQMFAWLVTQINQAMALESQADDLQEAMASIGVLDIYGFEVLANNSFEQLCINYCNESLHQFFVSVVFKIEQAEYEKQAINWHKIKFVDNQATLNLLAVNQMNLFALIDEDSNLGGRQDSELVAKMMANHEANELFEVSGLERGGTMFSVQHFAGQVLYNATGFLQKNRDVMSTDVLNAIAQSSKPFVMELFGSKMKSGRKTTKRSPTVATQFKKSLAKLLATLRTSNPFFVRCIKPNEVKKPAVFDEAVVVRQLRYSGMMSTIAIRKAGYPYQHTFEEFRKRYWLLHREFQITGRLTDETFTKSIAGRALGDSSASSWQSGISKIFLKADHDHILEAARDKVMAESVRHIQRLFRGAQARHRFRNTQSAMRTIVHRFRAYVVREEVAMMTRGFERLQNHIKMLHVRARYLKAVGKLPAYTGGGAQPSDRSSSKSKLSGHRASQSRTAEEEEDFGFTDEQLASTADGDAVAFKAAKAAKLLKKMDPGQAARIAARNRRQQARKDTETIAKRKALLKAKKQALSEKKRGVRHELVSALAEQVEQDPGYFGDVSAATVDDLSLTLLKKHPAAKPPPAGKSLLNLESGKELASAATAVRLLVASILGEADVAAQVSSPKPKSRGSFFRRGSKTAVVKAGMPVQGLSKVDVGNMLQSLAAVQAANTASASAAVFDTASPKCGDTSLASRARRSAKEHLVHLVESAYSKVFDAGKTTSSLDKLRLLTQLGITFPAVRDEIYAQVLVHASATTFANTKLAVSSPATAASSEAESKVMLCWTLMSLCLGCFAPSTMLIKYVVHFIRDGPALHAQFCEDRLVQTMARVGRSQPVSWLELQAVKLRQPIQISVTVADGHTTAILVDSSSTVEEVRVGIIQKVGIVDGSGYTLYIQLHDYNGKGVRGLVRAGGPTEPVMDAVALAEMYSKLQGGPERDPLFGFVLRREMFPPWYEPHTDAAERGLMYSQVCLGVRNEDYVTKSEKQLAKLTAKHYFVEFGPEMDLQRLSRVLPAWLPPSALAAQSLDWWVRLVEQVHARGAYTLQSIPVAKVQAVVILDALAHWRRHFSHLTNVTVQECPNPTFVGKTGTLCLSGSGVEFVCQTDGLEDGALQIAVGYHHLISVLFEGGNASTNTKQVLRLVVAGDRQLAMTGLNIGNAADLLSGILFELRRRSNFAVAIADSGGSGTLDLAIERGDLVQILRGMVALQEGAATGKNLRTNEIGRIDAQSVILIPSVPRPTEEMLELFRDTDDATSAFVVTNANRDGGGGQDNDRSNIASEVSLSAALDLGSRGVGSSELDDRNPTSAATASKRSASAIVAPPRSGTMLDVLEVFGKQYFRPRTVTSDVRQPTLWEASTEPLSEPLLKTSGSRLLAPHSIAIAEAISKWQTARSTAELALLADVVVGPALHASLLRDEVFCQLGRQLAMGLPDPQTLRTWELMLLCINSFRCGPATDALLAAIFAVVSAPTTPYRPAEQAFAMACKEAVAKFIVGRDAIRQHPPHALEIVLLLRLGPEGLHRQRVHLPDGTFTEVVITSRTKCSDIVSKVIHPLNLSIGGKNGIVLELKRGFQVHTASVDEFFYDAARALDSAAAVSGASRGTSQLDDAENVKRHALWVAVMKVAWVAGAVGDDVVADERFHYPQEIAKLQLRGHHVLNIPDAIAACALQLVADAVPVDETSVLARIPQSMHNLRSATDWAVAVGMARRALPADMAVLKAKQHLLAVLSRSPTFGAAVFEVVQTSVRSLPDKLWLSIDRKGMVLLVPNTKNGVAHYKFADISHWESSTNGIKFAIAEETRTVIFLCRTPFGKRISVTLNLFVGLLASMGVQNT